MSHVTSGSLSQPTAGCTNYCNTPAFADLSCLWYSKKNLPHILATHCIMHKTYGFGACQTTAPTKRHSKRRVAPTLLRLFFCMLTSQQNRGFELVRTSCLAPHHQLRCVIWVQSDPCHCFTATAVRALLFCRARTTCSVGAGWRNHACALRPHVTQAHSQLVSQLSHPTLAWEQADASWLDNLYTVGQQADQLVQRQLDGNNLRNKRHIHHA